MKLLSVLDIHVTKQRGVSKLSHKYLCKTAAREYVLFENSKNIIKEHDVFIPVPAFITV